MYSKSVLRTAVDLFYRNFEDVFYFPAYEIVLSTVDPYKEDGRHLVRKPITRVFSGFLNNFVVEEDRNKGWHQEKTYIRNGIEYLECGCRYLEGCNCK